MAAHCTPHPELPFSLRVENLDGTAWFVGPFASDEAAAEIIGMYRPDARAWVVVICPTCDATDEHCATCGGEGAVDLERAGQIEDAQAEAV